MHAAAPRGRPVTAIVGAILDNLQDLARSETRLVRAELQEEARKALQPLRRLVLGCVIGLCALELLLAAAVILLSGVVALWVAAALMGALAAVLSLALVVSGRRGWRDLQHATEQATQKLGRGLSWKQTATHSPRESRQPAPN